MSSSFHDQESFETLILRLSGKIPDFYIWGRAIRPWACKLLGLSPDLEWTGFPELLTVFKFPNNAGDHWNPSVVSVKQVTQILVDSCPYFWMFMDCHFFFPEIWLDDGPHLPFTWVCGVEQSPFYSTTLLVHHLLEANTLYFLVSTFCQLLSASCL